MQETRALVIAHRGASGYLPEHTLAAYAAGYAQGADYVEPDLVATRDGALLCLHDIHLEGTTDVAAVFPDRARDDGRFYAADFTLEEIRTLHAVERLPGRFPQEVRLLRVPTFEEMVQLVEGLNRSTGRAVGVYPELKAGQWHNDEGLDIEQLFADAVADLPSLGRETPIFVQSFEPPSLRKLRELGVDLPFVQLVGGEAGRTLLTDEGLAQVATYAQGLGPAKGFLEADPSLVERAHAAGLEVHPYTFRADDVGEGHASYADEVRTYVERYGIDGLFTDFPDQTVQALRSP